MISSATLAEIEDAAFGHADLDCLQRVIDARDFVRAPEVAWCAKIHCDDCPSGPSCPNPSSNSDWSAAKCHAEALTQLGFAARKTSAAVHAINWDEESLDASPGASLSFPAAHDTYACDDTSSSSLLSASSASAYTYVVPSSPSSPLKFSASSSCDDALTVQIVPTNYSASLHYYHQALSLWPSACGALGYLAELHLTAPAAPFLNFTKGEAALDSMCTLCPSWESENFASRVAALAGATLPPSCVPAEPITTPNFLDSAGWRTSPSLPLLPLLLLLLLTRP
ncbi:hypothetical protein TeGR_g1109 [Tetraparma gracilis]|uniref:Uncharacterized protein n=1 Tax=Tetraparma gracilis TaxID=2962635 RepID=A0ABQ6N5E6_9STRA|nr:hypothetical protein TeGR_g1109 [Tetraparma gracilis]